MNLFPLTAKINRKVHQGINGRSGYEFGTICENGDTDSYLERIDGILSLLRSLRKTYQYFVDVPLQVGTILNGRYRILKLIGTGSYGLVYHCQDLKSGNDRVVKQLRQSKQRNKNEIKLFENEVSVLRKLDHPNMPGLYEDFVEKGSSYYVMSFIDGDNLEDQIFYHQKKYNEIESLQMVQQLLAFVAYLHQKKIYHLDLRIPNILVKEQELFLLDFGLAKQAQESVEQEEMRLQDYYDVGEILLYLLYTTYTSKNRKALPWTEELSLEKETVHLLKRLLQLEEPYDNISEIAADLKAALKAQT